MAGQTDMISNQKLLKIYEKLTYLYPEDFRKEYQKLMIDIVKQQLSASSSDVQKLKVFFKESGDLMTTSFTERLHKLRTGTLDYRNKHSLLLAVIVASAIPAIFIQSLQLHLVPSSIRDSFNQSTGINLLDILSFATDGIMILVLGNAFAKRFKSRIVGYLLAIVILLAGLSFWGYFLYDNYYKLISFTVGYLGFNAGHSLNFALFMYELCVFIVNITNAYIFFMLMKLITSPKFRRISNAK